MTNRIRYLTTALLLAVWGLAVRGQEFNPADPAEPGQAPVKLTLVAVPAEGGSVSGGGKYVPGTTPTVRASAASGFVFLHWTNGQGEVVSTSAAYAHPKGQAEEVLTAHFGFSPGNPNEPTEIAKGVYYTLSLVAEEGGSVSGGGRYLPDKQVRINASCQTGYVFAGWYSQQGVCLSTSASYNYTTTEANTTLTARFRYDPSSPNEPPAPSIRPKHYVTATATEGGTVNISSVRLMEGESVTLTATRNTGYDFVGWYLDGEFYTTLLSFSYTVGTSDVAFEARFVFNPSSPNEPQMSADKRFAFYLMNRTGRPGEVVNVPLYLTSLAPLGDMTFQLTFPERLMPDLESLVLSAKAVGYELSVTDVGDGTYTISAIGGITPSGNQLLLSVDVPIPDDKTVGGVYQVKINQVSVTDTDGAVSTASTRNGSLSVFRIGDVNVDGAVNISDVTALVNIILGKGESTIASDVNEDGQENISDVTALVNIILGK